MCSILLMFYSVAEIAAGTKAQIFAEGTISTGHDYCTTFTPDGHTLFFVRTDSTSGLDAIYQSELIGGFWAKPSIVEFSSQFSDTDPVVSPDGSKPFMSHRPTTGTITKDDYDIWFVEKRESRGAPRSPWEWRLIRKLPWEGFPSVTAQGTGSVSDGRGDVCFIEIEKTPIRL
jgi:hypothetical protein